MIKPGRALRLARLTKCDERPLLIVPLDHTGGDRSGTFVDPFGHIWTVATHVEDVPPDEMERRAKEASQKMAKTTA